MKEKTKEKDEKATIQVIDKGIDFDKGTVESVCCERTVAKLD